MIEEDVETAQIVEEQIQAQDVDVAEQQETEQQMNFRALRESKENHKREKESYKKQCEDKDRIIAELRSPKKVESNPFFSGDPDDWPTNSQSNKNLEKWDASVMQRVEKMLVSYKYPNAQELITKYGNEVPPKMTQALANSGDLEAAIEAIQMTPGYIRDHAKEHINAIKAKDNANRPKSTLGAGNTGAVSKSSRYAAMSAGERLALQDKFLRGYKE